MYINTCERTNQITMQVDEGMNDYEEIKQVYIVNGLELPSIIFRTVVSFVKYVQISRTYMYAVQYYVYVTTPP